MDLDAITPFSPSSSPCRTINGILCSCSVISLFTFVPSLPFFSHALLFPSWWFSFLFYRVCIFDVYIYLHVGIHRNGSPAKRFCPTWSACVALDVYMQSFVEMGIRPRGLDDGVVACGPGVV
ncbi:hypothetical protein OG21DRAFT_893960 [Imleria badia]|nr:hypothetical protein OG21DRAFT_893960 [Imleria badia]